VGFSGNSIISTTRPGREQEYFWGEFSARVWVRKGLIGANAKGKRKGKGLDNRTKRGRCHRHNPHDGTEAVVKAEETKQFGTARSKKGGGERSRTIKNKKKGGKEDVYL